MRDRAAHRWINADGCDMTKRNRHSVCLSGHTYVTEHVDECKTGALYSEPRSFAERDEGFYRFYPLRPCGYDMYHVQRSRIPPTECIFCFILYGSQNKQRLFPYTTLTDWFL